MERQRDHQLVGRDESGYGRRIRERERFVLELSRELLRPKRLEHGGVEVAFSKRMSLAASYNFQWVKFDQTPAFASFLSGGHSHGASADVHHRFSERTSLIADYDIQHAVVAVGGGPGFNVQNGAVGIERRVSASVRLYAAVGVSRLDLNDGGLSRTGPSYRAGLTRRPERSEDRER